METSETTPTDQVRIDALIGLSGTASLPAMVIRLGDASGNAFAQLQQPSRCQPLPVLDVGEEFTGTGTAVTCGAAAHEAAHLTLGHNRTRRRLKCSTAAAVLLLLIAISAGLPTRGTSVWVPYLAFAVFYLVRCRVQARMEYQADARAVDILNRAGLSGRACMTETLSSFLPDPKWHKYGGWLLVSHPPTERRLAIISQA